MPFTKGHTLWKHPNCRKTQFKAGQAGHSRPHTPESRLKMSMSKQGQSVGEKNGSWKGGITPLLAKIKRLTDYKAWQRGVFARDNYTCRVCKRRGSLQLTAHHLTSFSFIVRMLKVKNVDEARNEIMLWNIRNGVTLCLGCHKETPNYAWRASQFPRDRTVYAVFFALLFFVVPQGAGAATFGYTSVGGTSGYGDVAYNDTNVVVYDAYAGSSFTGVAGTLDSVTAYIGSESGDACDTKALVYEKDSDGSDSHGLVAASSGQSSSGTFGWRTFTLNNESITATDYILGISGDASSLPGTGEDFFSTKYDTTGSTYYSAFSYNGVNYGTPADPLNKASFNSYQVSIYATYTATGGGGSTVPATEAAILF